MDINDLFVHGRDEALKDSHPEQWQLFQQLDVDGSGTLDKTELWLKMSVKGEEWADQIISMVDLNGDGVVDLFEFMEAFDSITDFKDLMMPVAPAPPAPAPAPEPAAAAAAATDEKRQEREAFDELPDVPDDLDFGLDDDTPTDTPSGTPTAAAAAAAAAELEAGAS
eukprot:SAG22_NODE_373_length_11549_cov_12.592052_8_plen_167_part_00